MKAMDLIDRNALGVGCANPSVFNDPAYAQGWNGLLKIINDAPVVDAKPVRHGRWIEVSRIRFKSGDIEVEEKCSECGRYVTRYGSEPMNLWCPTCGTKMDRKENEDNGNN